MDSGPGKPESPRARRWCVPPAVLREPTETLEGSLVLDEVGGPLAVLLWQALRDVVVWSAVAPAQREGLFAPEAPRLRRALQARAGIPQALEVPMAILAALVADPRGATPDAVTLACGEVARWAEGRAARETTVWFAQAGALASPLDAAAALEVGNLAAVFGRHVRAESWVRRAIGLSRRSEDWETYGFAFIQLGSLHISRGDTPRGQRYLWRALRAARRHGVRDVRGGALHALFLQAASEGSHEVAERFARGAIRAYGRRHPVYPRLMHDVAAMLVAREAHGRAMPLLNRLLPFRRAPAEHAATLALLARAAAGLGDRRTFEHAWSRAWSLLELLEPQDPAPGILADLARAASQVRSWDRVGQAVHRLVAENTRRGITEYPADIGRLATEIGERGA